MLDKKKVGIDRNFRDESNRSCEAFSQGSSCSRILEIGSSMRHNVRQAIVFFDKMVNGENKVIKMRSNDKIAFSIEEVGKNLYNETEVKEMSAPMQEIIYAEYIGNHTLRLAYNTGEEIEVDFRNGFDKPVFAPLKDEEVLKHFDYSLGFLQWQDGEIDIAPEYLLEIGKPVQRGKIA